MRVRWNEGGEVIPQLDNIKAQSGGKPKFHLDLVGGIWGCWFHNVGGGYADYCDEWAGYYL